MRRLRIKVFLTSGGDRKLDRDGVRGLLTLLMDHETLKELITIICSSHLQLDENGLQ